MTGTKIEIKIEYLDNLDVSEAAELMMRIKGCLGTHPVAGFHFDALYDEDI